MPKNKSFIPSKLVTYLFIKILNLIFKKLIIKLYVLYRFNIHIKFNINKIIFNIQSTNLFLFVIFYYKNLKLKYVIDDIIIDI